MSTTEYAPRLANITKPQRALLTQFWANNRLPECGFNPTTCQSLIEKDLLARQGTDMVLTELGYAFLELILEQA